MENKPLTKIFAQNAGKTPSLTGALVDMRDRRFNDETFFAEAEKAGYAEARIFFPGQTLIFEKAHEQDRITAFVDANGHLQKLRFG